MGNFDSICVFLCFYMDMNCFRLVRHVVSSWFRVGSVAADGVGGLGGWLQMVLGSCLWFQLVSGGFGWFRVVYCFSSYACWILFLKRLKACNFIKNRFQQQGVFIRNLQNFEEDLFLKNMSGGCFCLFVNLNIHQTTIVLNYNYSTLAFLNHSRVTAQEMKFSIKNFFNKCDQIRSFQRIWSHLLKKSLWKTSFFVQWVNVYQRRILRIRVYDFRFR